MANLLDDFEQAFCYPITNLNIDQLYWLVQFAENVRLCKDSMELRKLLTDNIPQAYFGVDFIWDKIIIKMIKEDVTIKDFTQAHRKSCKKLGILPE